MKKDSSFIDILRLSIEKDVFITEEMVRVSLMGGEKMNWLFDFRIVTLQSEILNAYSEIFWEKHKNNLPFQVCGLEVAAVPLVAAIVMKFNERGTPINGFFIRKSRKKSGLLKMVEGNLTNDPVIIVDDLINTGSSIIRQIDILRDLQKEIKEIFTILRLRDIDYYSFVDNQKIPLNSIFELNDFRGSLGLINLLPKIAEGPTLSPFEDKLVWSFKGLQPNFFYVVPKSGPVVSEDKVFFGTDDGTFFARETETGRGVWQYKIPFGSAGKFILSTAAIYQNFVLFGAYDGNLYALNKNTGKPEWVFMEADWVGSSPCVAEDLGMVFVGLEFGLFAKQGGIVGINVKSGEKIWEYRSPKLTHGSPAYSKKYEAVACGSNDGVLYVLNAKTGLLMWSFQMEGEIKYAPCFSDDQGVVVVIGHGEVVYVLEIKTGKILSTYKMGFGGYSTPLIVKDTAICTSLDKHIHCFNIFTGELIWKYNTGARCFATPILIDGNIYIGSNNAKLFEINPKTGLVTGIFHTRERIVNKIAYDPKTKIFFIPTFANEIFAIKKKLL